LSRRNWSRRFGGGNDSLLARRRLPPPRFSRHLDMLLMIADVFPVEHDVGILRFDLAQHVSVECLAPHAHTARRAEDVQDP
jgi:hypothetical protein